MLEQLIAKVIDRKPALRQRMLSAILLGGNVLVKDGKQRRRDVQAHPGVSLDDASLDCVIAYSTFDQAPPNPSLFGRTTVPRRSGAVHQPGGARGRRRRISIRSCPSAPFAPGSMIAHGIAGLGLTQPTPSTVWWSQPDAYRAQCESIARGERARDQPAGRGAGGDTEPEPRVGAAPARLAVGLGNLINVVKREAAAFARAR